MHFVISLQECTFLDLEVNPVPGISAKRKKKDRMTKITSSEINLRMLWWKPELQHNSKVSAKNCNNILVQFYL
jgi:hypothetical protein